MKSAIWSIFFLTAVMAGIAPAQNSVSQTPQSPSAPQSSTPALRPGFRPGHSSVAIRPVQFAFDELVREMVACRL
jgi:hypothetical protein